MTVPLYDWHTDQQLRTQEELEEYLRLSFASNDIDEITKAIKTVAKAKKRLSRIAEETGLNRSGLYHSYTKGGNPTASSLLKVMNSLGYSLTPTPLTPRQPLAA